MLNLILVLFLLLVCKPPVQAQRPTAKEVMSQPPEVIERLKKLMGK
jgi:hypothetical protein